MIKNGLKEMGYSDFCEAKNGTQAWDELQKCHTENRPVDFIITDWMMPEMDGLEFVKRLRADARFSSLPCFMVTAEAETENLMDAVRAGIDGYITKPVTQEQLQAKFTEYWSQKKAG